MKSSNARHKLSRNGVAIINVTIRSRHNAIKPSGLMLKQYPTMIGKINKPLSINNRKNQLSPFCSTNHVLQFEHLSFMRDHEENKSSAPQIGQCPLTAFLRYVKNSRNPSLLFQ